MSNQWLRLWHEMPNDPKWRTIARISKQPISLVLAVYCHLLVDASRNVTRGHATVTAEDLASALDVTEDQIDMILHAMEGRVLSGMHLLGWEKRQPKREDQGDENTGAKSAAQRKAEQRLREKQSQEHGEKQQCHELSRNVTLDTDKDKDKEYIEPKGSLSPSAPDEQPKAEPDKPAKPEKQEIACPHESLIDLYAEHLPNLPQPRRSLWPKSAPAKAMQERWRWVMSACHESGQRKGQRMAQNESEGLDWFSRYFAYVSESDFLTGRSGKFTSCDLGWLVTLGNFTKVLQGNYHVEKVAA